MDILSVSSASWFGLLFLGYAAISLIWTTSDQAIWELVKLLILAQAFVVGSLLTSLKQIFEGLALGITISSVFVLFGFKGGLFININTLAETAVIVLVGLCVYRLWLYIPGVLPSVLMNGSRAAILSGFIIFIIWLYAQGKRFTAAYLMFTAFIVCTYLYIANYRLDSIYDRLNIWKYALSSDRYLLGYGLGEFHLNGYYNTPTRAIYTHNDLLQIYFELGLIGVILTVGFFWRVLQTELKEKYIVGTFIIISLFDFPFHLPVSACICFICCGYLVANRDRLLNPIRIR